MRTIYCVLWIALFLIGCKDRNKVVDALHIYDNLLQAETLADFANRLEGVNSDIANKGFVFDSLSGKQLITGYDYGQVYDWDLYFENIYQIYNDESEYCFANVEAFLLRQEKDGFIKRSFGPYNYGEVHMFKPFLSQIVLLGMRHTPNLEWLAKYYDCLVKYTDCWYTRYDKDQNHLCVWYNADHSGMDNQNSRVIHGLIDEGVDLNCYLYRELKALAKLAKMLEKKDDALRFEQKSELVKKAINELLWDEKTGFYYDRLETTGELNKVKGISGFTPLFAGIVDKDRADRLVKEHLINPDEFWAAYPVNTLAQDEKGYHQEGAQPPSGWCNWNGTTWIPFNYMIFHGLLDYGYEDVAKELMEKTFEMVYVKNSVTREYYNADTAEGYGRNPFYGWSSLAYLMPLEFELKYNLTNLDERNTLPLVSLIFDFTENKK